ncbi:GbsR/MarR family transcriptional regulator [Psychromicrobium xiongbiense]|uniref:GbsR/MarR family transcriptional regulator n=1 Tax=Psychromicrobium xiongbiense TaxID=3051184 RepID=UPI002552D0AF|nr:MarR family transcriptional regulator [Psychromicrobium sp. YIM S02556]
MAQDEQALRAVVEQSAAVLTNAGFPKMPARVLMTLMTAEDAGLTAREIAEALGVSAAAVSGAVRYLQTVGIVHRVAQVGSRRDLYSLPEDSWYTAMASKSPVYGVLAGLSDKAVTAIGDAESAQSLRFAEMARFYRFIESRMPDLLAEWETLRGAV